MFVLVRALVYAAIFVSLVLVFLPARVLTASGIAQPETVGGTQALGLAVAVLGAGLALWCVLTFAFVGRGTPAPFDPPRRLVVIGPYSIIRNPMYVGAVVALLGAAMFYESIGLLVFAVGFLLATQLFVLSYEEPTLRRIFGEAYVDYCRRVGRWWPRRSGQ